MSTKNRSFVVLIALSALLLATLACNAGAANPPMLSETPTSTLIPLVYAPTTAPIDSPPGGEVIQTDLPTFTLEGGMGYAFAARQVTNDDWDVYWNNDQLLPRNRTVTRMVSLGIISSPADVTTVSFAAPADVFTPTLGEGFALEIDRDNAITYAIIRLVAMDPAAGLTFDFVYPYTGGVE